MTPFPKLTSQPYKEFDPMSMTMFLTGYPLNTCQEAIAAEEARFPR
jgi:hypothetical protein